MHMIVDGKLPDEAIHLAHKMQLGIVAGEDGDLIKVVQTPEVSELSYMESVSSGNIIAINLHDEFVSFNREVSLVVIGDDIRFAIKPRLIEQHRVYFKFRIISCKNYSFYIVNDDYAIDENESTLKDICVGNGKFSVK